MTGRLLQTGTVVVARTVSVGLALSVGFGLLAGCTGNPSAIFTDKGVPAGSFQLVGFSSCDDALRGLRNAAKAVVGPYGFGGGGDIMTGAEGDRAAAGGAPNQPAPPAAVPGAAMDGGMKRDSGVGGAPSNYSGTNTHEAGVDEPDLVKTDGRRIVTVSAGVLRVVDAASRSLSGYVELSDRADPNDVFRYAPADLLIAGDHALVLLREQYYAYGGAGPVIVDDRPVPAVPGAVEPGVARDPDTPTETDADPPRPVEPPIYGPRLLLVDISGQPQVLASYRIDGGLVDARQVGATARVVIRSYPRLVFPYVEKGTDANRTTNNKKIIDKAGLDEWLPRIETTTGGSTARATVNCDAIARPATYTGTNMLTVLTFDLAGNALGDGRPTTIVADGDTVYSNGPSLYVASDQRWRAMPMFGRGIAVDSKRPEARTEIYKFETSDTEPPRFVAGGSVPGYLINQYAMSELDGKLRVAATSGEPWADPGVRWTSQSGVYVLEQSRNRLREIGKVEGLGKGERIYAVRFVGTLGYVVTFRQTDPLYTVDVSDPTKPRIRGELKITGYSAYLHPAGGDKLIGIGQEATGEGRVAGTQVSLFSIADADKPIRLARYYLSGANSEAEFDPHAFLYWPADGLLVVPLQFSGAVGRPGVGGGSGGGIAPPDVKMVPTVGALVLRVVGDSITELGFIRHPSPFENQGYPAVIRRSLVIDQTLWTVSDGGLMATDSRSLNRLAWIPFN